MCVCVCLCVRVRACEYALCKDPAFSMVCNSLYKRAGMYLVVATIVCDDSHQHTTQCPYQATYKRAGMYLVVAALVCGHSHQ